MTKRESPAPESAEYWLGEILAVIHGDGGHYRAQHGNQKATEDAIAKWYARRAAEPARRQLDTVAGLEMHAILHPHHLDTSPDLLPCPFCGHEGAFTDGHKRGVSDNYTVAAACSNTSCGVRTPEHYKDRASAAVAWNRRALSRT